MDPNVTLEGLREAVYNWRTSESCDIEDTITLIESIDGWITNGGFLPKDWRP